MIIIGIISATAIILAILIIADKLAKLEKLYNNVNAKCDILNKKCDNLDIRIKHLYDCFIEYAHNEMKHIEELKSESKTINTKVNQLHNNIRKFR